MKIRRGLTGVLCSFLDAFASRYSDYDGYWIFGLLASERGEAVFDLIHENSAVEASPVLVAAARIARSRFSTILEKSGIPSHFVPEAKVVVARLEAPAVGAVNGRVSSGHRFSLRAEAKSDLGKRYCAEKIIFVAPHDASTEHRSVRRNG